MAKKENGLLDRGANLGRSRAPLVFRNCCEDTITLQPVMDPSSVFKPAAMNAKQDTESSSNAKRILLVDDDAEIIESLRYALSAKGYEVIVARDGNQGMNTAERENPDLVILDMMMPKRSGFLVLEKLRKTADDNMRIIMITANEGSRHKAYAEMLGVDDYIRKPFAMDRLLDAVNRLIG